MRIGKDYLTPETLEKGLFYRLNEKSAVHITPVLKGAKRAGIFQTVLGVALIAASFFIPTAGLFGGLITKGAVFGMGAAMALGGVAQLLTKMPSISAPQEKEKKQSTAFSNLGNLMAQERPVPLAYGQILTGSLIISQGVETLDIVEKIEKVGKQNATNGIFKVMR